MPVSVPLSFGAEGAVPAGSVTLPELLGALSHALDLTEGQPPGHCLRATWIGMQVARRLGLAGQDLSTVYHTVLLKDLGCSSNAARICQLYLSDDLGFKRDFKTVNGSLPQVLGFVFSHTGLSVGLAERFKAIFNILQNGGAIADELIETRCQRGAAIAAQLRFPPAVCEAIHALDEHWDGGGRPDGRRGFAVPLAARIALLAQVVDVVHRSAGRDAALAEVRRRSGRWFDPAVVAAFEQVASDFAFWPLLGSEAVERLVLGMAPEGADVPVDEGYLDDIARAFAQIIDAKSPFTSGHSERVAVYADMVAAALDATPERRRWLRRAALLHDIGKLGVSSTILDKPGGLDEEQWRAMRNHAALSERILGRIGAFRGMAVVGGRHHERLDGTGYPRGLKAEEIDLETRIVSVADVFDALTADRPYRAAMSIPDALAVMDRDAGLAFDPICLDALKRALAGLDDRALQAA